MTTQELTPHFSGKALLVSFIFLLANLTIYGLKQPYPSGDPKIVSLQLVSGSFQNVQIKSAYDASYRSAQAGQTLDSGTFIKTGDKAFADLILDNNLIRLDQQTELRILQNNFSGLDSYVPQTPRLQLELLSGGIWVKAFDSIEIHSKSSITLLHHNVAILTYNEPINRVMVITGDADLRLLNKDGKELTRFVIPLNNQITFVDSQITAAYDSLKPSKLKKELKMSPLSSEVLTDEWVVTNLNEFVRNKNPLASHVIQSELVYKIRVGYEKFLTILTFIPEARQNLILRQVKTIFLYWLGGVEENRDLATADVLMKNLETLLSESSQRPWLYQFMVETLFEAEYAGIGNPSYQLKEFLIKKVSEREGPEVFRLYLADLRKVLSQKDLNSARLIASKWSSAWTLFSEKNNLLEYDRQSRILNYIILTYSGMIDSSILDIFDDTGRIKMMHARDLEETRFEVVSDRLQIVASLIDVYRYIEAKNYLKKSYLSLNIESLSPDLVSTKIFLENGQLLARRIQYAESTFRGAAQPIEEAKFLSYLETLKRDKSLSDDLKNFFESDPQDNQSEEPIQAPTIVQVASRFLDVGINVNYADIMLQQGGHFFYDVKNARLIDREINNAISSFDATYDFISNSVTNVVISEKAYAGSFTLPDIVTLLKRGDDLLPKVRTSPEDVGLLITDQEKIKAQEGQAIARDVAKQVAYKKLTASGLLIPDPNDIEVLDQLSLNFFHIKKALISPSGVMNTIQISFDYHSTTGDITHVLSKEGVVLFEKISVSALVSQVVQKTLELQKQLETVAQFKAFATQNQLAIDNAAITYTSAGLLFLTDLELLTVGLKVSGLYNPDTQRFILVNNELFSAKDMGLKDYFKRLTNNYIIAFMKAQGFDVTENIIQSTYPFDNIRINGLKINDKVVSFILDIKHRKAINIIQAGEKEVISSLMLDELYSLK